MADVVLVEVGARRLAVPAARVREVATLSTVTPVPTAPPPVVGLTQLRGQILPVLSPFVDETPAARPNDALLVVELGPARAALLCDRVLGVGERGDAEPLDVGALFDELRKRVQR